MVRPCPADPGSLEIAAAQKGWAHTPAMATLHTLPTLPDHLGCRLWRLTRDEARYLEGTPPVRRQPQPNGGVSLGRTVRSLAEAK